MKTIISCTEFIDNFRRARPDNFSPAGAKVRPGNFTPAGLTALYNYLTQQGDDKDNREPKIKLYDPTVIRCEFAEYQSLDDLSRDFMSAFRNLDEVAKLTDVIIRIDDTRFIIRTLYYLTFW